MSRDDILLDEMTETTLTRVGLLNPCTFHYIKARMNKSKH